MNRRSALVSVTLALTTGALLVGAAATADEHEGPPLPEHGHMLLLDATLEFTETGPPLISYETCIDLANARTLRLNAHHEHLHFGRAGEAQHTAGNVVVPTAPFPGLPWTDCASFAVFFPPN